MKLRIYPSAIFLLGLCISLSANAAIDVDNMLVIDTSSLDSNVAIRAPHTQTNSEFKLIEIAQKGRLPPGFKSGGNYKAPPPRPLPGGFRPPNHRPGGWRPPAANRPNGIVPARPLPGNWRPPRPQRPPAWRPPNHRPPSWGAPIYRPCRYNNCSYDNYRPPKVIIVPSPSQAVQSKTIREGERGKRVRLLQLALVDAGITVEVDGFFGNDTRRAVIRFQRSASLPATGIADEATLIRLGFN